MAGKKRTNADTTLDDAYRFYLQNLTYVKLGNKRKYRGIYDINRMQYRKICQDIMSRIMTLVIENNFVFQMPYRMGRFRVTKKRNRLILDENGKLDPCNISVDHKATNELYENNPEAREKHKKVYNINEHTNRYRFAFRWSKKNSPCTGITRYKFIHSRANKRALAKYIKENLDTYEAYLNV